MKSTEKNKKVTKRENQKSTQWRRSTSAGGKIESRRCKVTSTLKRRIGQGDQGKRRGLAGED